MRLKTQQLFSCASLFLLSACGPLPWPDLKAALMSATENGLTDYSTVMEKDNLVPSMYLQTHLDEQALGRTLSFTGPHRAAVHADSPCQKLLPPNGQNLSPDEANEFHYEYLKSVNTTNEHTFNLKYLGFEGNLQNLPKGEYLLAAKVTLEKVFGYSAPDWTRFGNCCKVTGTCGQYAISSMYKMKQTAKALRLEENTFKAALGGDTKQILPLIDTISGAVNFVHQSNKSDDFKSANSFWSHFGLYPLPAADPAPLQNLTMALAPTNPQCSSAASPPVTMAMSFQQFPDGEAEKMVGYNVTLPSGWTGVTLAAGTPANVRVTPTQITCRPDSTLDCKEPVSFSAKPPSCAAINDYSRSDWQANYAIYVPGNSTGYRSRAESFPVFVTAQNITQNPTATIIQNNLSVSFDDNLSKDVSTVITLDPGSFQSAELHAVPDPLNDIRTTVIPIVAGPQAATAPLKNYLVSIRLFKRLCNSPQNEPFQKISIPLSLSGTLQGASSKVRWIPLTTAQVFVATTCPTPPAPPVTPAHP